MLRDVFFPWFYCPESRFEPCPDQNVLYLLDWTSTGRQRDVFLHPEASWRRMFMIQPPPLKLSVRKVIHGHLGDTVSDGEICANETTSQGVTMDVIYDITQSFWEYHQTLRFCLEILDHGTTASMRLCLMYTVSCVTDLSYEDLSWAKPRAKKVWNFQNDVDMEPARNQFVDSEDQFDESEERWDYQFNSALTKEKGGVSKEEFVTWKEERSKKRNEEAEPKSTGLISVLD